MLNSVNIIDSIPEEIIYAIIEKALHDGAPHVLLVCKNWLSYSHVYLRDRNRDLMFAESVVSSSVEMIKVYMWACPIVDGYLYKYAIMTGKIDALKYAVDQKCEFGPETVELLAQYGDVDMMNYMRDICGTHKYIIPLLAKYNRLDLLKYARENGYEWGVGTQSALAANGQFEMIKYAHENGCPWGQVSSSAANVGRLDILKYAFENGCALDNYTCIVALRGGHLDVLEYLHEKGAIHWCVWVCAFAALSGNLEMIKYARKNNCPWDERTSKNSAKSGNLEMFKYVHDNGCPIHENVCAAAARQGHLEILIYAHKNGYPINDRICINAVKGGHLHILKYAHENDFPWNCDAYTSAIMNGHLDIIKYLQKNGCPIPAPGMFIDYFSLTKVLGYHLCDDPVEILMCSIAIRMNRLNIVKYLFENQLTKWTNNLLIIACAYGHDRVINYLKNMQPK